MVYQGENMSSSITLETATFVNDYGTEFTYHRVLRRFGETGWVSDADLQFVDDRTASGDWCIVLKSESEIGMQRVSFGTLTDYRTGESIRPATREERTASREALWLDGGAGIIEVDGVSCYVE
jgi:hypothetical protein